MKIPAVKTQEIAAGVACGRTDREEMADVKRIGGTKGILENSRVLFYFMETR